MKLFSPTRLGKMELKNRIVMAPMTRSRAIDNIPNDLMAQYYRQRSNAGLIITEGTAPSPNALGYPRIPGIFNNRQIERWQKITQAVHGEDGKIFLQLMHTGRVSHPANMPPGSKIVAPSAIGMSGEMYTDAKGMQPYPVPQEMTLQDIENAQDEFVTAAENAIEAGFDGVELHGANGYLIDQFTNPASNQRDDDYSGSLQNHCRFAIEVAQKVAQAISKAKTGIRLSPGGVFNDMVVFEDLERTYEYLAGSIGKLGLAYIHIIDQSFMGFTEVPERVLSKIHTAFGGPIIFSGGMDKERAETMLTEHKADLIAFGRPFLANPDLVSKMKHDLPLNAPDEETFYTPGEKGYTDYAIAKD